MNEKPIVTEWLALPPEQRNFAIGELLKATPMRQVWLMWHLGFKNTEGVDRVIKKNIGSLGLSLAETEEWLKAAQKNKTSWDKAIGHLAGPLFEQRHEVKCLEQVWHVRYSDTPGGGWVVIEELRKRDAVVQINSCGERWRVSIIHHGDDCSTEAATMQEAACLMLLKWDNPAALPDQPETPRP